jgi:AAHS family 4-hydroxybenzoate transporter-like MFS transporter
MNKTVDVATIVDESPFGLYQFWVAALCALCLIMDGFDAQAMGYVAPTVIRVWHIDKEMLAPVFSASLFGMLIGSLALSALADKIGRRPVLVCSTLFFSVCMFGTGFSNSIYGLIAPKPRPAAKRHAIKP